MLTPDAVRGHWAERFLPQPTLPYSRLMRLERPIGWWLLLLPCWWSLILAGGTLTQACLMMLGAIIMRGAGCVWNDISDRDLDAQVERTRARPIPSGQVSVRQAYAFLTLLLLAGLVILLQFSWFAIMTGIASLVFVVIYPFMKRVTFWPQLFLGFAFSWGGLMGFAAEGSLPLAAFTLYIGTICWVIGYDTIYAHQDIVDDMMINVKSTARLFNVNTKKWLVLFYSLAVLCISLSLYLIKSSIMTYIAVFGFAIHLYWQIYSLNINSPQNCLELFRSNRDAGLILTTGLLMSRLFTA
jgi:4-hydroxybenzoate polyprenyltransferase